MKISGVNRAPCFKFKKLDKPTFWFFLLSFADTSNSWTFIGFSSTFSSSLYVLWKRWNFQISIIAIELLVTRNIRVSLRVLFSLAPHTLMIVHHRFSKWLSGLNTKYFYLKVRKQLNHSSFFVLCSLILIVFEFNCRSYSFQCNFAFLRPSVKQLCNIILKRIRVGGDKTCRNLWNF